MKYKARTFNKESYNRNDEYAKNIVSKFLKRRGHYIESIAEDFTHDIKTVKNGEHHLFEVEVKTGYPFTTRDSFKFNTVSFLGRKERLHKIKPFHYVIVCKETEHAVYCHSSVIYKRDNIEEIKISTQDRNGRDLMYRVDKLDCKFFNLND